MKLLCSHLGLAGAHDQRFGGNTLEKKNNPFISLQLYGSNGLDSLKEKILAPPVLIIPQHVSYYQPGGDHHQQGRERYLQNIVESIHIICALSMLRHAN